MIPYRHMYHLLLRIATPPQRHTQHSHHNRHVRSENHNSAPRHPKRIVPKHAQYLDENNQQSELLLPWEDEKQVARV